MALSGTPDPDVIGAELGGMLSLLHHGIERSTLQAIQSLENDRLPFEPTAHATIARLHLRQFMKEQALEIRVGELTNCGVLLVAPGYEIRVLKSGNGGTPPLPGDSKTLLRFYNQVALWQPRLPGFTWYPELQSPPLHLIVHWHTTPTGQLIRGKWACPESATPTHAQWYFDRALPNPVLNLVKSPVVDSTPSQDDQDDNVGFTLRDLPFTGTEAPLNGFRGDDPTQ
jgi:hypothetical protein